ncbi:MAG: type II toxin-antitoxin system prevent-host-death family antitoxin [Candidatus Hydrogenedentes bacterium]|nr:type II toxin-antitoxin system prevent-host-death family antitoxin [Candidatus Hydrogenedentota bacterium]MBI3117495.1 type II toxin-antitoxin system prevent-host-death family antitoxin [Candidatus Hydrogenedentota bacterium]
MRSVGAYEAKTHFSQLLDRVTKGERITIMKHGVPVAVLQPVDPSKQQPVSEIIAQIKEFREHHRLEGPTIREMIDEGRR